MCYYLNVQFQNQKVKCTQLVFQQKCQPLNCKTLKKLFIAVHILLCDAIHICPTCHNFKKTSQCFRDRGQHWSVADRREIYLRCQSYSEVDHSLLKRNMAQIFQIRLKTQLKSVQVNSFLVTILFPEKSNSLIILLLFQSQPTLNFKPPLVNCCTISPFFHPFPFYTWSDPLH